MKILLNSTCVFPLPPPAYAGTEWIVYDLAVLLRRFGHEVSVAAPKGSQLPEGMEHIPTSDPTWDASAEMNVAWPAVLKRIWKEETKEAPFDIIHDHSFMGWPYMAAKDHPEIRVTWTLHSYSEMTKPPPVRHPNLITLSKFMAAHWSMKLGVHVEYVYNGIDPSRFEFSDKKGDRYLFLGRIARIKGAHEAVEIARRTRVPIDIVGEDRFTGEQEYVMRVMDSTKGTTARYVSHVDAQEKVRFLRDARALIFPSLWGEPFGLAILEANASGTPVIALKNGAIPEIVVDGKTGFLCSSVDEMVVCIGKESEIDPYACREHVVQKFSSERMAREYEARYQRILNGSGW